MGVDSIKNLLQEKADNLDISGHLSELDLAQSVLDRHFAGDARAKRLDKGNLFVHVSSSSAASEVRIKQIVVLDELKRVLKTPPLKLVVRQ